MTHGDYNHVEIPADDMDRAKRFYASVFGWTFEAAPSFPDYFLYQTPSGEGSVGGGLGKRSVTSEEEIRNYIEVDSVDRALVRVAEMGGSVLTGKSDIPGVGWFALVRDSEGNRIGLFEALPR